VIRIFRPTVPPDPETAKALETGRLKVMAFRAAKARQSRFAFSSEYWGKAKERLKDIQHGKCAFCESVIGPSSSGDIGNFRPKSVFPELAYEWNNLLLVCQICNANKREQFPTAADGSPLLVDPASEDPSESIAFDDQGAALPITQKGEITIKVIALNRPELIQARAEAIQAHVRLHAGYPGDDVAYAGAIRSVFPSKTSRQPVEKLGSHSRKIGRKSRPKSAITERLRGAALSTQLKGDFSYISSIHITNFRALSEVEMKVSSEEGTPGWQVLLGENASGKSTVLKAIAMALMGSAFLDSVTDYQKGLLRRFKDKRGVHESESGSVTITFVNGETTVLGFDRSGLRFESGANGMDGTIRGYGSMRLLPEEDEVPGSGTSVADVGNLFHPRQSLVNTDNLLTEFHSRDRAKFEQFATHIRYLLRLEEPLDVVNGTLWVPINGTPVRIAELSDGYQAMIALAVDLMNSFQDFTAMESAPGILLLDELGTHLHPRWRLEFVERLRSTFRGLQVIATTHEPLCLRGLRNGEVGLLQRNLDGNVEFVNGENLPKIEGMRVDQILTSSIFGLHSTIDPRTEARFVRYYALLAKQDLTPEELKQRDQLAIELRPQRHLAYTRRDQMMYEAIDEFLAKEAKAPRHSRLKLKAKTMQKLQDMWNESGIPGINGGTQ
jgi:uncharacterized protein (TIGR02646 family)